MVRYAFVAVVFSVAAPLRAELRVLSPAADLGTVKGGLVLEQRFELANVGPAALEIIEVRRGCGCLEAELERKKLSPGDKTKLVLRIRTLGQAGGARVWHAWLQYRENREVREAGVSVAVRLQSDVTVHPAIVALYVESTLRQEITVTDCRSPGLRVTAVRGSVPALKAFVLPREQGTTKVVLEVAARDLTGPRVEAQLDIETDDPLYRHLQVPVVLARSAGPTVTALPNHVRIAAGADGRRSAHIVRLRAGGERTVRVDSITCDDPGITCTWAAGPDSDVTLRVQIDGRRLGRTGNHVVHVELAEPTRETLTLPVVTGAHK